MSCSTIDKQDDLLRTKNSTENKEQSICLLMELAYILCYWLN